jgi:hypothetical protein
MISLSRTLGLAVRVVVTSGRARRMTTGGAKRGDIRIRGFPASVVQVGNEGYAVFGNAQCGMNGGR